MSRWLGLFLLGSHLVVHVNVTVLVLDVELVGADGRGAVGIENVHVISRTVLSNLGRPVALHEIIVLAAERHAAAVVEIVVVVVCVAAHGPTQVYGDYRIVFATLGIGVAHEYPDAPLAVGVVKVKRGSLRGGVELVSGRPDVE